MRPIRLLLTLLLLLTACAPRTPQPTRSATLAASPSTTLDTSPTIDPSPTPIGVASAPPTLAIASTSSTPSTVDADTTARHRRIFEQLWNTLNTQYVYPDFNGVDWAAAYIEFKARIDGGLSDEDFWRDMTEMIERLDDGHSFFLTPSKAREQDDQLQGNLTYGGIGIDAGAQEDKQQVVIYSVFPGSPAEEAGLRAHDAILAIDGRPILNPDGTNNLDQIRGRPGTPIVLTLRSPGEAPREVTLLRRSIDGTLRATGRLLSETPGNRIGYILIPNLWGVAIESSARQTLAALMAEGQLDGLMIDMRFNSGGLSTNLLTLLSFFTSGQHGEFVGRDNVRVLVVTADPIGNSQDVPLIILVSDASVSYAEVFSGVLREAGRARLVGMITAGNIETNYGYDFEDGSRAWIARETFVPPSGANWEDAGIVPDISIDLAWDEFTEENDPYIAAALELLAPPAAATRPTH